jgi:hypothetical protein
MRKQGLEKKKIQNAEEGMRKQGGGHVRRHQKRAVGQMNSRSKSHKYITQSLGYWYMRNGSKKEHNKYCSDISMYI